MFDPHPTLCHATRARLAVGLIPNSRLTSSGLLDRDQKKQHRAKARPLWIDPLDQNNASPHWAALPTLGEEKVRKMEIQEIDTPVAVPVSGGYTALISEVDAQWVLQNKWHPKVLPSGVYAQKTIRNGKSCKRVKLHRLIMNAAHGQIIDHINGNTLDNRRSNLRFATSAENVRNQKPYVGGTSNLKGVSWHKASSRWRAQISVDKKKIHLGVFQSETEAHTAYCRASEKYHGEFGRTA